MSFFDPGMAEQIWSAHFTFAGVRASEWGKKEVVWKEIALQIADFLSKGKSDGIRLSTGGGKTIIAILATVALGYRTLFLTPTRYLTGQHKKLLDEILGCSLSSRVITGETPAGRRIWNSQSERFVFATGAVCYSALTAEKVSPNEFDLVVFDEFHRAKGRYDYVLIAPEFIKHGIPRLGLSASPGDSEEEIELVQMNTGIDRIISPKIQSPATRDECYILPPTPEMERADEFGWSVLGDKLVADLWEANLHIQEKWRCSAKELEKLCEDVSRLPRTRGTQKIRRLFTKYRLYLYGHHVFMTGSYHAFLRYAKKLATRKWWPDRMLLGEPLFQRLIKTAEYYLDEHPKVKKLEGLLRNLRRAGGRAIVFFADRATAKYCKYYLEERCILTETVFGGRGSIDRQTAASTALKDGLITAALCTSVWHEGVDVPEVDLVVNYAVATSGKIRLQSGGRTGRMNKGCIAHIVLDHPLDRLIFFAVHNEVKKIKALSEKRTHSGEIRNGQLSLFTS